jgi:hypothetical protein
MKRERVEENKGENICDFGLDQGLILSHKSKSH